MHPTVALMAPVVYVLQLLLHFLSETDPYIFPPIQFILQMALDEHLDNIIEP